MPSFPGRQCEGLNLWDGKRSDSHACFLGLHRESWRRISFSLSMSDSHLRRFSLSVRRKSGPLVALIAMTLPFPCLSQKAALKTNIISDIFLSPGIGAEVAVARDWTVDISAQGNFWTISGHKWKHWLVQPEARYWLCRTFSGHFFGLHAIGGIYNIGNIDFGIKMLGTDFGELKDKRFQGWGAGAGIAYGYAWPVHPRWNIEAEIGLGWVYSRYDSYPCAECGEKIDSGRVHNYVGPTKLAVNIVYLF